MKHTLLLLISLVFCSCIDQTDDSGGLGDNRAFSMGFTPWPYDATVEAVEWTYGEIGSSGDIASHHMEEGVPWPEALGQTDFSAEFMGEIQGSTDRPASGQKVLLSPNPLNMSRDGMALYRGSSEAMALPDPWDGYSLDDPQVKEAYSRYVLRMADLFEPNYLITGIEVNLLIRNAPPCGSPAGNCSSIPIRR